MAAFADILKQFFYAPDEDIGELFRPSIPADEMTLLTSQERPGEYLAFFLAQECYAIPIGQVREIVRVPPLTEIPRSADNLLGVIKLRGEILPVYDVKMRLKLCERPTKIAGPEVEPGSLTSASRILIVRDPEGRPLGTKRQAEVQPVLQVEFQDGRLMVENQAAKEPEP